MSDYLKNQSGFSEYNEELHRVTVESIEKAFIELMKRKKYDEIRVSHIAERAGVSRSAFYKNYKSKDDLLRKMLMPLREETVQIVICPCSFEQFWLEIFSIAYKYRELLMNAVKSGANVNDALDIFDENGENTSSIKYEDDWTKEFMSEAFGGFIGKWANHNFAESPEQVTKLFTNVIIGLNGWIQESE